MRVFQNQVQGEIRDCTAGKDRAEQVIKYLHSCSTKERRRYLSFLLADDQQTAKRGLKPQM